MYDSCKIKGCKSLVDVYIKGACKGLCNKHWDLYWKKRLLLEDKFIQKKKVSDPVEIVILKSECDPVELAVISYFKKSGLSYFAPILGKDFVAPLP